MATSWSFSKHSDFTRCKKYFWLKHEQRVPEPQRPLRPGQTEQANDRGTRVHDNCERYVRGQEELLCNEADKYFGWELELMRVLYAEGLVSLEGEWGMDSNWEPCEWKSAWLRLKLDAIVLHSPYEATVVDYKTGRKFGNEVKHAQQLQLYALAAVLRHPELEEISSELWYLDIGEVTRHVFTRQQALRFKKYFDDAGRKIVTCTSWPANPNKFSCQYCMYGPKGSRDCAEGV